MTEMYSTDRVFLHCDVLKFHLESLTDVLGYVYTARTYESQIVTLNK